MPLSQELIFGLLVAAFAGPLLLIFAGLWFGKLRRAMTMALGESVAQQIKTTHQVNDVLVQIQKRQKESDENLQLLAQSHLKLRQDLNRLVEHITAQTPPAKDDARTVH